MQAMCEVCGVTSDLKQVAMDGKEVGVCDHCLYGEI